MKKIFTNLLKLLPTICLVPFTTSCGSSQIVFANYESYMADDVMENLTRKQHHNIAFLPYETNEEIENKFNRYYDIAVPTTYGAMGLYQKHLLSKIDWEKFQIKKADGTFIKNGKDALASGIFSQTVTELITELDQKYFPQPGEDGVESILDIGIPYFLQSFSFAYKGESIPALDSATNWNDILSVINSYNDPDERFTPKKERKIAVVDDARSVFGICNTIKHDGVNPEGIESIDDFKSIYEDFTSNLKKGYTYFNTDSGQIISTLCKHYHPDSPWANDGASSAIAYNGDILYAAQGGGLYDAAEPEYFHFCKLDKTLIALDMVVMNKKNDKNESKKQEIYDIVKDVCLSGTGYDENIDDMENRSYKYDSVNNFNFIQYTSPLQKIWDYVMNGNFFIDSSDDPTLGQDKIDLYRKIFDIEESDPKYVEEQLLSDLVKSNMHWAYSQIKTKL